ncbi:MAG TPA: branched-chain amino acid aminotransferase [Phnomibacter sp.]|nr:branched-chain amino acid aminotransferase [Phnomibacter sp.]
MIAMPEIAVQQTKQSKLPGVTLQNIPFGRVFTDHMLVAEYADGQWQQASIMPYQPLMVDPSNAAWHYGQAIFEGIKAYRQPNGEVAIFRPYDNWLRFNRSAERMMMPPVPEEIFIEGLRQLIALDKDWVPEGQDHSLYIRPFMIATDDAIGVRPSNRYKFIIILSPTGPYFAAPMRIYVEEQYVRAAPGGTGFAKAAGNYAGSMYPAEMARRKGYDQVLWTDANEHKYVQEIGVMNVFFALGSRILTPSLDDGTILAGVTRQSAITLLTHMGYQVEERNISIDEIVEAYQAGQLTEVFGAGTAATIAIIKELGYRDITMQFNIEAYTTAPALKARLSAIREGLEPDAFGWMLPV